MRRFLTLVSLVLFTIPFGVSISGCSKKEPVVYCNGGDSGAVVGQVQTILLSPINIGISLNQGEMGQVSSPAATDCKGTTETVRTYTYATFDASGKPDMTIADVVPSGTGAGRLCAGTWNRNTGGGIADYTTCIPTGKSGTAYVTASGSGASSNALPIYVHPVVTNVVLGPLSTDCINDPATNCSPAALATAPTSCTVDPGTGCCTAPPQTGSDITAANGCLSQGTTSQLAARVYAGTAPSQTNISCLVGHLAYSAVPAAVVTIDQNGVATAQAPGGAVISAAISLAGSSAGSFSTCPPVSIQLSVPLAAPPGTSVTVSPNNTQPINAVVLDKNGTTMANVPLTYVSTTPTTIPAGTASVTPTFPGAAAITAICLPPTCNPSPLDQLGLNGNGKPVTSNAIDVTTPGVNSTDLYIASTNSLYLVPVDFTTNSVGTPVRLPYQPNSMVISNDGSTIYMGSANELMTFTAATNSLSKQDPTVVGNVLAISPDGTTLVITDPTRGLVYLYSSTGTVVSTYGGVAVRAEFTPDSQTAYITLGDVTTPATATTPAVVAPNNQLLIHSTFTGWFVTNAKSNTATDVAVTVPSVGAFFAGNMTTALGYCPITTQITNTDGQTTTTNIFYPDAGVSAPVTDRIAATNDGLHILGATVTPTATLTDLAISTPTATPGVATPGVPTGACPAAGLTFAAAPVASDALPGVTATAITGVDPASDSSIAFVTYTGSGGVVPTYSPSSNGAGTLGSIALATSASGTPIAPVAGVLSADNQTFYAGTTGDNVVHLLVKGTNGYVDNITTTPTSEPSPFAPIVPQLPCTTGFPCPNGNGIATPNLLVQKPRKATS
jgi:trimeric autotransporter adhesin